MLLEAVKASEAHILTEFAKLQIQLKQNMHVTKVKNFVIESDSDGSEPEGLNEKIKLHMKEVTTDKEFDITVNLFDTIEQVKAQIENQEGLPSQSYRLIFNGKTLKGQYNCRDYNIKDESRLLIMIRLQGGGISILVTCVVVFAFTI